MIHSRIIRQLTDHSAKNYSAILKMTPNFELIFKTANSIFQ
jgi:hypothetical protein